MTDWSTLTGTVGMFGAMAIFVIVVAWAILLFGLPFFVYGAWQRAKECSQKLDRLIQIQLSALPPADAPPPPNDGWS